MESRKVNRKDCRRQASVTREAIRSIPAGGEKTFELRDRSELLSARSTKVQVEMVTGRRFQTWSGGTAARPTITFKDITGLK